MQQKWNVEKQKEPLSHICSSANYGRGSLGYGRYLFGWIDLGLATLHRNLVVGR